MIREEKHSSVERRGTGSEKDILCDIETGGNGLRPSTFQVRLSLGKIAKIPKDMPSNRQPKRQP